MSSAEPKISIVMPAYNAAAFIGEAIESVLRQNWANWELLIIDDGSPDDIAAAVAPYLSDSRIIYRRFANGGPAVARMHGIAMATGEFMTLLDSDDRQDDAYLAEMMAYFREHPDMSFVTSDAMMFGIPEREGRRYAEYEPQDPPVTLDRVLTRQFNVFGSVTARLADVREVGGFDVGRKGAEDFELWTRLLARGKRGGYIAKPLMHYRRRPGTVSTSTVRMQIDLMHVYLDRLAEQPADSRTAEICRQQIHACLLAIERANGEAAIRRGDMAAAAKAFAAAGAGKSLSWKLLLPLMRIAPGLAAAVLRWRDRRNAPYLTGVAG